MFQQFSNNVLVSVNQNLQDSTVYRFADLPYPLVLESCHVNCFRPDGSTGNRLKQGFQCEIASYFIKISGFGISGDGLPAATLKKWCTDLNRDFYVQEGHDVWKCQVKESQLCLAMHVWHCNDPNMQDLLGRQVLSRKRNSAAFSCAWQGWHIFHRFGNKRCCKRYFSMMAPQSGKNHGRGIRILKSYSCHPVCNIGYFWSCPVSWVGDLWVQTDFIESCGAYHRELPCRSPIALQDDASFIKAWPGPWIAGMDCCLGLSCKIAASLWLVVAHVFMFSPHFG